MMKRAMLAVLLLSLVGMQAFAQMGGGYEVYRAWEWTAIGAGETVNVAGPGAYNHRLIWTGLGTRTTCSIKLEQSIDGTTWTDLIAATDCTTNGTATVAGWVNFVRMNVTVLTGAGNTVWGKYSGLPYSGLAGGTQYANGAAIGTGIGTLAHALASTNPVTYATGTVGPLTMTVKGGLRTTPFTNAGVEIPFPAALGANGGLKIEGVAGGVAVPVSAATLPLPAGAATSALQGAGLPAALSAGLGLKVEGTAASGTPATGVVTVQGVTAMTPIKTSPQTADAAEGAVPTNPSVPIAAQAASTEMAAVDAGDSVTPRASAVGGILVHSESLPNDQWQASSNGTPIADTTFVSVVVHTDDYYTDITNIMVTNGDAAVGTVVKVVMGTGVLCGTGTAIIFEGYAASGGGGFALGNGQGVLFSTTAVSNDVCIAAVTTSAEITWSMKGFKSKLKRN